MSKSLLSRLLHRIAPGRQRTALHRAQLHQQVETLSELLSQTGNDVRAVRKAISDLYIDLVFNQKAQEDSRVISTAPGQVYSQVNEDGIVSEIFSRIGVESRKFVEIAAGDGIENTTRLLLETGWSGLWVEAGAPEVDCIRHIAREPLESGQLVLVDRMITLENLDDAVISRITYIPDYISVDIDYNTSHILRRLIALRPRLLCVEYNAHYPPAIDYEVPYRPDGQWRGTTRFGASLKAVERIGREHGYSLVGCDIFGVNAFLVRDDLVSEQRFLAPFTAEMHYRPPRFGAVGMRGHARHPNVA